MLIVLHYQFTMEQFFIIMTKDYLIANWWKRRCCLGVFFFNSVLYIFNDDVLEYSHWIKKLYFYMGKIPCKQTSTLHNPRSFVKDAGLVLCVYICAVPCIVIHFPPPTLTGLLFVWGDKLSPMDYPPRISKDPPHQLVKTFKTR